MSTAPSPQPASRVYAVATMPEIDIWNWPLIDAGWRSLLVALGTFGFGGLAWQMSGSVAMGTLSILALMISMWRFWVPVRYHIRGRGIIQDCLGRRRLIPWRAIEQCRLRKRGVVLRFRNKDLFFDGFGAKYIDGRDQRDELIAVINFYRVPDTPDNSSSAQRS